MADVLVLVLVLGFFALCVAFIRGCDLIIGPDADHDLDDASSEDSLAGAEDVAGTVR